MPLPRPRRPRATAPRAGPRWRDRFPVSAGFARFVVRRAITLAVTVFLGIYLTVFIVNYGGYLDDAFKAEIQWRVYRTLRADPDYQALSSAEQARVLQETLERAYEARGLNEPVWSKSFRITVDLMTFNLGRSNRLVSPYGSAEVGAVILERLPRTLLLFTTGTILAAAIGIRLGLRMARKVLTLGERGLAAVSIVTTSVPSWVWGFLLLILLAYRFPAFPSGGMVSVPAKADPWANALDVLYHMALPLFAVVLASFGAWAYTTRNLVLQIQDDDYVLAAKARGLPERVLTNRYVLRAASPPIVTALAITVVATLSGAIILEMIFNWPGIGRLLWDALDPLAERPNVDVPVVAGIVVMYAYLFAFTMFAIDLVYALLDPRVRATG